MSTTVRIRDEDKRRLDALQARLTLDGGERLPLEEVLARALRVAAAHRGELLEADRAPKLDAAAVERLLSLSFDFGFETDESTIDHELYGIDRGRSAGP